MKEKRVLFIGNSFTMGSGDRAILDPGGVPFLVAELVEAADIPRPETAMCAQGGRHFYEHLADETGALSAIRQGHWDAVVLQEFSTFPTHVGDAERFMADGSRLHREIQCGGTLVKTVLFETWAREHNHQLVSGEGRAFKGGWRQMQAELRENYAALQRSLGTEASVAWVGDLWEHLLLQPEPLRLHAKDDYHANRNGSLAAAAIIARCIYGGVRLRPRQLAGVPPTDMLTILRTANDWPLSGPETGRQP